MFAELPEEPQAPPSQPTPPQPEPQPMASQPVPTPPPPAAAQPGSPAADERMWGMLACLSGILFYFLGPLVIWLVQKDKMPFVNEQGKEALNFEITITIAWVAVGMIIGIAGVILAMLGLGFIARLLAVLYPVIGIYNLVMSIIAGLKANEGVLFRYPISLRLIK